VEEQSKRVGTTPEPTLPTVPGPAPVLDTNLLAIPPATVLSNPPAPAISNPPAVTPSNAAPAPAPQK
jgi:hypothetical protein